MPRLYLIRHGRATAGWGAALDPGLDETGLAQARVAAAELARIGPLRLVSSPLRRTRETAAAFESIWSILAEVDGRIAEIPSPGVALADRAAWLREIIGRRWPELPDFLHVWRKEAFAAVLDTDRDTVFVTHFIVINAIVGQVLGDDRVVCFRPGYCSRTELSLEDGVLSLIAKGEEETTQVL